MRKPDEIYSELIHKKFISERPAKGSGKRKVRINWWRVITLLREFVRLIIEFIEAIKHERK